MLWVAYCDASVVPEKYRAIFERLIPADAWPAIDVTAVVAHLDELRADPHTAAVADRAFEALHSLAARDDIELERTLDDPTHAAAVEQLMQIAAQVYYGAADSPGARMIGFTAGPKRAPAAPIIEPHLAVTPLPAIDAAYDAIVIGAGAGGGMTACRLAEAGVRVLLVERGDVLTFAEVGRDHLRNHRLSLYGQNTGPARAGNPRVALGRNGSARLIDAPSRAEWHNNAMTVGGGTRVYQGMAWRFLPDDFRMASLYGVPDGSSLADWPLGYDDLEPHYAQVEWDLGVCGDAARHRVQGARSRAYPMPPLPANPEAARLAAGAAALGLSTGPVPLLINSVPYNGRAQCVRCGECVGFACPSDAKSGSQNTLIPRALATGRCTLVTRCRATRILTDAVGRVTGVRLANELTGADRDIAGRDVIVSCGAIETARLLLLSRSASHPDGLGNHSDQVGRHLQGHLYTGALGLFDDPVQDSAGPGVSIATCDHNHGNADVIGGGVIANEVVKLPIIYWYSALPPDAPRRGLAGKRAMRDSYRRTGHVFGPVHEIPRADNRVTLATDVTDSLGQPVARLEGAAHPETLRTAQHQQQIGRRWLEASGARDVWTPPIYRGLSAGQHQAGTCRMGADPATSVTDPDGRVHGHDNLWIADGSVHVTNGGFNPVLTIYALAHRTAARLVALR
jgi:choline dehydrogenase-like flavoprotein